MAHVTVEAVHTCNIILDSYQKAKEIDAEFIADQAESDYGIEKELLNKIITLTKVE